jgi:hypothetical protein
VKTPNQQYQIDVGFEVFTAVGATQRTTRRHIPEDGTLQYQICLYITIIQYSYNIF